jgi:hypothetical protein
LRNDGVGNLFLILLSKLTIVVWWYLSLAIALAGQWCTQRERGSGGGSPLVKDSTQLANEWNPYSD